jgi:NitT/TauT family transport system substrate-binding protein
MRKLVYILSLLWMAGMVGACRQTDGTGRDMDSTALRLGVLPTVDCLPFYYADSMGLFDSAGIQVKLVTFDAGMDADTAYMNGSIDGIVTDLVKACIWQGQGDTAQVVMVGDLRLWLVTAPKARLLSVESLKEKIIGITRLSAVDYFTDRILSSAKMQSLDLNKPQINEIKLRTLMVDQDQYDGAILPEPFASEAVARGAKRLTGTEDLKVERLLCVLFGDSIGKVRKDDVGKIRQVYDLAVERLNADTLSNVLEYIPEAHRMYLPDTLYIYKPLNASVAFADSMLVDVKAWVKENEFLGQGAKGQTK